MIKQHLIEYEFHANWQELDVADCQLIDKAFAAAKNAYAPYSKFHVGAAALLSNSEVVVEVNEKKPKNQVPIGWSWGSWEGV